MTHRPVGRITRGTTGTNRLRRVDRWVQSLPALRQAHDPLVVDLGYGATATTTLELADRLPGVRVVGIEIDPERVRVAQAALEGRPDLASRVEFRLGGFEVPLPGGRGATVIRAMNVLRQYEEAEVAGHWARLLERLEPGGALVEGTCSESGRIASWVTLSPEHGAETLTIALHLPTLQPPTRAPGAEPPAPSIAAERLPKALIHRNVAGEPIHAFLSDLDRAWAVAAPRGVYGPTQRWLETAAAMAERWPIVGGRSRWRLGELTVEWSAVAPTGG